MTKKRQTYPKEDADSLKETIQKLKSQVRNLQKKNRELKSENATLLDAWAKAEVFLEEITEGVPLDTLLKHRTLPKKALRKKGKKEVDEKEVTRQKWAKWRKENL